MSILSDQDFADLFPDMICSDVQEINENVGDDNFFLAVVGGTSGSGLSSGQKADVLQTLDALASYDEAGDVNVLISGTKWKIVSGNLGGDPGT